MRVLRQESPCYCTTGRCGSPFGILSLSTKMPRPCLGLGRVFNAVRDGLLRRVLHTYPKWARRHHRLCGFPTLRLKNNWDPFFLVPPLENYTMSVPVNVANAFLLELTHPPRCKRRLPSSADAFPTVPETGTTTSNFAWHVALADFCDLATCRWCPSRYPYVPSR